MCVCVSMELPHVQYTVCIVYTYTQAVSEYTEGAEEWCSDEDVSNETQTKVLQTL